ncbi:MAG: dGTP triphosphohydrolase [Patescibacteria group bacterium]|nr:dNTP triphosphohydrolase [Patescibacteria group bacterium]
MANLKPYAVADNSSKGREHSEAPHPERTAFQLDRDRVIHSRAFRRMNGKTQVFVAGHGDHYRTRLTHTLEVAQISRDLARSLGLNEDLAETIALAHDLGHTPFGHAGEMAMDRCMQKYGRSFEHNEQSKRVVTTLEYSYPDFPGLNLSFEVLDGLSKHQTPWDNPETSFSAAPSLEAQIVNIADEIAYSNHDIDDGLRAGVLSWDELIELPVVSKVVSKIHDQYGRDFPERILWARTVSGLIGLMIDELLKQTCENLRGIETLYDVYAQKKPLVGFGGGFSREMGDLKEFLQEKFYLNSEVLKLSKKGEEIIETLFEYYLNNLSEIPEYLRDLGDDIEAVKDYLSGMSDFFARERFG